MTSSTLSVYLYTLNTTKQFNVQNQCTCEDLCIQICKELGITPTARLLFSLRIYGNKTWIPYSSELNSINNYEFRMRFKMPNLMDLKQLDRIAYNYFFEQIRRDFVDNKINEIEYSKYEQKIVGLIITDMYKDMIEKKVNLEYLRRNYKTYSPKIIIDRHPFFLRKTIMENLKQIKNTNYSAE